MQDLPTNKRTGLVSAEALIAMARRMRVGLDRSIPLHAQILRLSYTYYRLGLKLKAFERREALKQRLRDHYL